MFKLLAAVRACGVALVDERRFEYPPELGEFGAKRPELAVLELDP